MFSLPAGLAKLCTTVRMDSRPLASCTLNLEHASGALSGLDILDGTALRGGAKVLEHSLWIWKNEIRKGMA